MLFVPRLYRPRVYPTSIPMSFEEHALAYTQPTSSRTLNFLSRKHDMNEFSSERGEVYRSIPILATEFHSDPSSLSDDSSEAQKVPKTPKRHQCTRCPKSFDRPSTLKTHMNSHTGERPFKCAICSASFSVRSNMKRHMKCHSSKRVIPY